MQVGVACKIRGRARVWQPAKPSATPTSSPTLCFFVIFSFSIVQTDRSGFCFSFFLRSHKDSFKLQIMDNLYFFSFIFDLSSSFFFSVVVVERGGKIGQQILVFFFLNFLFFLLKNIRLLFFAPRLAQSSRGYHL